VTPTAISRGLHSEICRTEVFQEIEIASCANHRNIVSVREFFISDRKVEQTRPKGGPTLFKVSLIMDFMEGGMVLDSLLSRRNGRYTEDDARGVMKQVLEGLEYLHARNVAHRDLKLENMLLVNKDDLSHVKIVDFGLSKHTTGMMKSVLGTPQFVSPEMLRRDIKTYGVYVDMWSAGVLLYIFLSGFPPFYDSNEHQLFKKIMAGNYSFSDPVWNNVSDAGKDLISKLLVKEPDRRLTATQALQHAWFSSMEGLDLPLQETRKNLMKLRRAKVPPSFHSVFNSFLPDTSEGREGSSRPRQGPYESDRYQYSRNGDEDRTGRHESPSLHTRRKRLNNLAASSQT